jgi:uncharacterized protein YjbI with pentapeptide repeats
MVGLSWEVGAFSEEDLEKLKATNECVGCDLSDAQLWDEDLTASDLTDAILEYSDLTDANLNKADLSGANLKRAILFRTNLSEANLTGANLTGADLTKANLTGTNLTGANLTDILLDEKAIATNESLKEWKKVRETKRLAEEVKRLEESERALEERKKEIASNPGFRDLKPGLTLDEIKEMNVCGYGGLSTSFKTCYDLDNIKFRGEFTSEILEVLRIDLGPRSAGGFVQAISELGEDDPLLNMRGALGSKYEMDYDWSERDRQLFNAGEKGELYTVYANGQVALVITRVEKEYSSDVRSYVEYRDKETGNWFLEKNRPKKATSSDF